MKSYSFSLFLTNMIDMKKILLTKLTERVVKIDITNSQGSYKVQNIEMKYFI